MGDDFVAQVIHDYRGKGSDWIAALAQFRRQPMATVSRSAIPNEVKVFVCGHDKGKCVRCSAQHDLQFDHIIPVAKSGGNGINNIQILCGDCNRLKSDSIV